MFSLNAMLFFKYILNNIYLNAIFTFNPSCTQKGVQFYIPTVIFYRVILLLICSQSTLFCSLLLHLYLFLTYFPSSFSSITTSTAFRNVNSFYFSPYKLYQRSSGLRFNSWTVCRIFCNICFNFIPFQIIQIKILKYTYVYGSH